MNTLFQDLRLGARSLRRSPGFAVVAILTLALGIGAGTAVFTAAGALLQRPLPYHDAGRLAEVSLSTQRGSIFVTASPQLLRAVRRDAKVLEGVAGTASQQVSVRAPDGVRTARGVLVSDEYFPLLGIRPGMGRWPAAANEVAISHPVWRSRFGGDAAVVGSSLRINGHPFRVVGVAPAALTATWIGSRPELWVPLDAAPQVMPQSRDAHGGLDLVARLRPGVTHAQAESALSAVVRANPDPAAGDFAPDAVVLRELSPVPWHRKEAVTGALRLLAVATSLLLLAACVNVAGILLARATARTRETAVRIALGASRGRVLRGVVAEAMLLTFLGAAAGVLVAAWLGHLLERLPWPDAVALDLGPGPAVWGFALLLALGTGAAVSLVPMAQTASADVVPALKGVADARRGSRGWMRGALVSAQIAVSLLLLLGAGLFLRALDRAWRIDPGFDPSGVLSATVDLESQGVGDAQTTAFFDGLLERARSLPGVESATLSMSVPFSDATGGMIHATVPGRTPAPDDLPYLLFNAVGPDYFHTLGIPVLRGRGFRPGDATGGAVVSAELARRLWPGADPLGKTVDMGNGRVVEVRGVVGEAKLRSLDETAQGLLYLPMSEVPGLPQRTLNVRVRPGLEGPVSAALAAEVRRLDADLPPPSFRSLRDLIGDSLLTQRLGALLVGAFGVAGLLLACVGVYGAMAYAVGQRTREIGVRMALGGQAAQVVRLVIRHGMVLTAVGVAAGVAAALVATRVVGHLLFGVSATDPLTFAVVSVLLGVTTLCAAYLPARHATRVDPVIALRSE